MMTTLPVPEPAQRRRRSITKRDRNKFLSALETGWSVAAAAELTGHSRGVYYVLRGEDVDFAEAWAAAVEAGTDRLEDEAVRRATGYDEDTTDATGALIRRVRRFDGNLLALLLKARRPQYRDGTTVQIGGAVTMRHEQRLTLADLGAWMATDAPHLLPRLKARELLPAPVEEDDWTDAKAPGEAS